MPEVHDCLPADVLLDHLQHRLDERESSLASRHLERCSACRAAASELERVLGAAADERPLPGPRAEARVLDAIRRATTSALGGTRRGGSLSWWNVPRRRVTVTAAAASFLLVALAAGLLGVGVRRLRAEAVLATVVSADDHVIVRRGTHERMALAGMTLRESDQVAVAADSSAVLALPDASRAELGPDSTLTFHGSNEGDRLELLAGLVAVRSPSGAKAAPLLISTPRARAEFHGTTFTLAADVDETYLRVEEGRAHLVRTRDGASVDVPEGYRAEVSAESDGMRTTPSRPGSVLLIVSLDQAPAYWEGFNRLIGDRLLRSHLNRRAFQVETRTDKDLRPGDLEGRALVIVSLAEEGVGFETALERIGLPGAAVPVLCFEPAAFPTLGLIGGRRGVDYDWPKGETPVEFPDPGHPLSGGLSGTRHDLFGPVGCAGWAVPAASAFRVAVMPGDPGKAFEFAYDRGRQMVRFAAPERRVGLFLDPAQVGEHSKAAWSLFEAAVEWCVEPPGDVR